MACMFSSRLAALTTILHLPPNETALDGRVFVLADRMPPPIERLQQRCDINGRVTSASSYLPRVRCRHPLCR
jgi:hypothetical protein